MAQPSTTTHLHRIALLIVVLAAIALGLFQIFDSDWYWHLAIGQEILSSRTIGDRELFSFTARGQEYINFEWLSDVLAAVLFRLGGVELVVGLKALWCGLLFALLATVARARGARGFAPAWLLLAGLLVIRFRLYARPETISLGLLATFDLLAQRFRSGGDRRLLLLLPVLAAVWANLHLGVVMGIVTVATHGGCGWLGTRLGWRQPPLPERGDGRWLLVAAAGCALATLLNPYGVRLYAPVLTVLRSPQIAVLVVQEWQPPNFADVPLLYVFAGIGGAILLASGRRTPLPDLALWAGTVFMALQSRRHVGVHVVLATPVLAAQLSHLTSRLGPWLASRMPRWTALLPPAVRLSLLGLVTTWAVGRSWSPAASVVHQSETRQYQPGLGISHAVAPVFAVDFIERHRLDGPVYNSYALGGYLMWRSWPRLAVFIDGRALPYVEFIDWWYRQPPRAVLDQLDIDLGLVAYTDVGYVEAFRSDPRFALAAFDDVALVFVDRVQLTARDLPSLEVIRPEDLSLRWLGDAADGDSASDNSARSDLALREIDRVLVAAPAVARAHALRGALLRRRGATQPSIAAFERACELAPDQAAYRNGLGTALLDAGDADTAAAAFTWATRLDPRLAPARFNLGLAEERRGRPDRALAAYRRAAVLDPGLAAAHFNVGMLSDDDAEARAHLERFLALSRDPTLRDRATARLAAIRTDSQPP